MAERSAHEAPLVDGIYEGSYMGWPNRAVVKVIVRDHRIADIDIIEHWELRGKQAESVVIQRIIEQQTADVDAVSGATNSSWVIMHAVQDALEKARDAEATSPE